MIFGASQLAQFMDRLGLSPAAMSATGTCSDQGTYRTTWVLGMCCSPSSKKTLSLSPCLFDRLSVWHRISTRPTRSRTHDLIGHYKQQDLTPPLSLTLSSQIP